MRQPVLPQPEISNNVICATSKGSDQPAILKGGCTGSSESTPVKMSHCWKSHVAAHILIHSLWIKGFQALSYKTFSCSTQLSTQFELIIKTKCHKIKIFLAFKLSDVVFIFIMLINVKMPTIVGILTFEQDKLR